jgi:hypothetical protein
MEAESEDEGQSAFVGTICWALGLAMPSLLASADALIERRVSDVAFGSKKRHFNMLTFGMLDKKGLFSFYLVHNVQLESHAMAKLGKPYENPVALVAKALHPGGSLTSAGGLMGLIEGEILMYQCADRLTTSRPLS